MRTRFVLASVALASAAFLATALPAQHALLRRQGNLVPVPVASGNLAAIVTVLLEGPTSAQRARGLTTSIPPGTYLVDLQVADGAATITLSAEFTAAFGPHGHIEDAIEQVVKTVLQASPVRSVHLAVRSAQGQVRTLDQLFADRAAPDGTAPPPPPPPPAPLRPTATGSGALAGRTIVISPGHGYYWHSTLGWTTQRGQIGGLTEDIHTNEIAMRYLIPALENMGARVISCRERGEISHQQVLDNDAGAPRYIETGSWTTSSSTGYSNGTYRFATTWPLTNATATWSAPVPRDGFHPVYTFYRAGSNRTPDAKFVIQHSGGATEVAIDQTAHSLRWLHLGNFHFTATGGAKVVLENRSTFLGRVVIADAVRIGAGFGSIPRGSRTSGRLRWQECCRYWAQFAGAPSSVYNIPGCSDNCDDVTARPKYAEWRGADAFFSLHTNAGGGAGTSSFIYNGTPTAGSSTFQARVHNQLVNDIRQLYCSTWTDRGRQSANFGEVRELRTMPGMLLELAFHDTPNSKDHDALHDPEFRMISGRAIARGIKDYFSPAAIDPPFAPTEIAVTQDQSRGLRVSWSGTSRATGYAVEQSPDGKGFTEVAQTSQLSWSTGPLPHGTVLSFRVRALNASGCSFPTEVLTAGTSHTTDAELLLVAGFDRLGEFVKGPENTRDYLRLHGDAIRRSGEFSLGFDAANNEAVLSGRVSLQSYRAVDWLLGEESTADETFSSAEQARVTTYLAGGGRLLVSGAEIGWDLSARGSAADRSFYNRQLGARYVRDDANTYRFAAAGSGVFAGLGSGSFDNGTGPTYDVDYPDVIAPFDFRSRVSLVYDIGGTAAIEKISGDSRVVNMGFPLETVLDPDLRSDIMTRALRFLLAPRRLDSPATVNLGAIAPITVNVPNEPNALYVLVSSLGLGSFPLAGGHVFPLLPDAVFGLSLQPQNGLFFNFQGLLSPTGQASASFVVPNFIFLRGLDFYFSGVTGQGTVIRSVLPWTRTTLQ